MSSLRAKANVSTTQSDLLNALRRLDPTGPSGFEGLIARLLTRLTGSAFYVAKSGRQDGRDMVSDRHLGTRIAVESKRYREDTESLPSLAFRQRTGTKLGVSPSSRSTLLQDLYDALK